MKNITERILICTLLIRYPSIFEYTVEVKKVKVILSSVDPVKPSGVLHKQMYPLPRALGLAFPKRLELSLLYRFGAYGWASSTLRKFCEEYSGESRLGLECQQSCQ